MLLLAVSLISCSGSDNPPANTDKPGGGTKETPLIPPATLAVQSDDKKIIIDWPLDTTVDFYQLYWSSTSGSGTAGQLVKLDAGIHQYTHEFLQDGTTSISKATTYYYTVIAMRNNTQSALSTEYSGKLKANPPPAIPKNVALSNQQTSITISWDNDTAITNYYVYWSTTSGSGISGTKIKLPNGQNSFKHEFTDTAGTIPLAKATDYFYVVTAQNSNGESLTSIEVKGRLVDAPVVVLPQPPATITITPQNSQIQLTWPLDTAVTNYNVYWSTTSGTGTNGTKVPLAANTSSFAHEFLADGKTRLSNGVDFYYVVTAFDGTNESVASTEVTARLKNKPWIMPLLTEMMGL